MFFSLNNPFAANRAVDEADVCVMKTALNRLGYYTPYEKTGITGIPDAQIFAAVKAFQKDNSLSPTGAVKPDDATAQVLAQKAEEKTAEQYIWRCVGDDKVRDAHAALNGTVRDFSDSPAPGEEYNCRCWAEIVEESSKKKDCSEAQEAFREASERFSSLDQRKKGIEEELKNLYAQHEALIDEAKNIFQKNWILGTIGPDSKGGTIFDFLTDNMIGNLSSDRLRKNARNIKRVRARIEYLKHQLLLISVRLKKAAKDVMQTKRELEICQRKR